MSKKTPAKPPGAPDKKPAVWLTPRTITARKPLRQARLIELAGASGNIHRASAQAAGYRCGNLFSRLHVSHDKC
jgi:hypothetical protein